MSDPTPTTPVTVQDRIRMAVALLMGNPAEDLATLAAALYTQTNPRYPWLLSINSRLEELKGQVDKLQAAVGAEPYSSLEIATVRGYLHSILQVQSQLLYGAAPSGSNVAVSDDFEIVDGRKYARFDGPIQGVTIAGNGYDVTSGQWSDWQAYIQTTDPAPQIGTAHDVPNVWLQLVGSGTINFSVAGQYQIRVYLKYAGLQTGTYEFTTEPYTEGPYNRYGIVAAGVPGFTLYNNDGSGWANANKNVFWQTSSNYWIRLSPGETNQNYIAYKDSPTGQWSNQLLTTTWLQISPHYRNIALSETVGGTRIQLRTIAPM